MTCEPTVTCSFGEMTSLENSSRNSCQLAEKGFEELDQVWRLAVFQQLPQTVLQHGLVDRLNGQTRQRNLRSAPEEFCRVSDDAAHIALGFRPEQTLREPLAQNIPWNQLGIDYNSGAIGMIGEVHAHPGLQEWAGLEDSMDTVEFGFQPFKGKLQPAHFLAKDAGASRRPGTAFSPSLKMIIHRGQAERAVEPIGPAQDRPNGLARKGEVMLAFETNHVCKSEIRNPKSETNSNREKNSKWEKQNERIPS
jgi:hypothetical protein